MRVLFFRDWFHSPTFATSSDLQTKGVGGTEFQRLMHMRWSMDAGHEVISAGSTTSDLTEEGVSCLGGTNADELAAKIKTRAQDAELVFLNSTIELHKLRRLIRRAQFVEVCQNGPHFEQDAFIDWYAFVGPGQLAYYSTKFPKYRRKFVPLFNVPPVETVYRKLSPQKPDDRVIWVGALEKQGFRRWAKAMVRILKEFPSLQWLICTPSYSQEGRAGKLPTMISDLELPVERLHFTNLTLERLGEAIASSRVLLASLGGEDGPVSYLDGHALGVPVLCGDDIFGKYANPEGTGLRCTSAQECYTALKYVLENPAIAAEMGRIGRQWVMDNYTETIQRQQLAHIYSVCALANTASLPRKDSVQSDLKFPVTYKKERLEIKLVEARVRLR